MNYFKTFFGTTQKKPDKPYSPPKIDTRKDYEESEKMTSHKPPNISTVKPIQQEDDDDDDDMFGDMHVLQPTEKLSTKSNVVPKQQEYYSYKSNEQLEK